MNYQTFKPQKALDSIVKFYWTLEVPFDPAHEKQQIVPDGCIEMTFNLGDNIRKFEGEESVIMPERATVMGQRTKPYFILPVGEVRTVSVCFYPHGFAALVNRPLDALVDREVPLAALFDPGESEELERRILGAAGTEARLELIETFLLEQLQKGGVVSGIVTSTVDLLLKSKGSTAIGTLLNNDAAMRRKLERHFKKHIGINPKQLGRVIRLGATLHQMLQDTNHSLSEIAYERDYFDQTHFIKDFKEFVGLTPRAFMGHEQMALVSLFYKEDP